MIQRIVLATLKVVEKVVNALALNIDEKAERQKISENIIKEDIPEHPKMSLLASKYYRLVDIKEQLDEQNHVITVLEQKRNCLEIDLEEAKGIFNAGKR